MNNSNNLIWLNNNKLFDRDRFTKTYATRLKCLLPDEVLKANSLNEVIEAYENTYSFQLGMHSFKNSTGVELNEYGFKYTTYGDQYEWCSKVVLGSCILTIYTGLHITVQCSNSGKIVYFRFD